MCVRVQFSDDSCKVGLFVVFEDAEHFLNMSDLGVHLGSISLRLFREQCRIDNAMLNRVKCAPAETEDLNKMVAFVGEFDGGFHICTGQKMCSYTSEL